jgi:hypothetical protein
MHHSRTDKPVCTIKFPLSDSVPFAVRDVETPNHKEEKAPKGTFKVF